ncbi:MAG: OmpA family protein [Chitinivibrionales bacterium]|nr:OmpA family protein [Chitinivibrionales bacterium]
MQKNGLHTQVFSGLLLRPRIVAGVFFSIAACSIALGIPPAPFSLFIPASTGQASLQQIERDIRNAYSNLEKNRIGKSRLAILAASAHHKSFKQLDRSQTTRKERCAARKLRREIRKAKRSIRRNEKALVKKSLAVLRKKGPYAALDFRKEVITPAKISYREYAQIDRAIIRALYKTRGDKPHIYARKRTEQSLNPGKVVLESVQFQSGSASLKSNGREQLDSMAKVLLRYSGVEAEIHGYTDNVGDARLNRRLSQKRAQAVADYFIRKGIDPSRITAIGMGEKNPIADNRTAQGRAQNRRVELVIKDQNDS